MEKECEYKNKCSVSKILIVAIISFAIVCGIMLLITFSYHRQVNRNFQNSITKTTEIISSIKIENQKNKQIVVSEKLAQAISNINHNEYEKFLRNYYEIQNNWLNTWLTILAIIIGLLGIGIPLCFLKFYESKCNEIDSLIGEVRTLEHKMECEVKKVSKKRESMTSDLDRVKKYVDRAEASDKRVEVNRYFISAMQAREKKNYTEALNCIDQALTLAPKHHGLILAKADILADMKQYEEAVPLYEQVVKHSPSPEAYNNYATTLIKLEKHSLGIDIFNKAIALYPKDSNLLYNRGTAFAKLKNFENAINDLEKIQQITPPNSPNIYALYNLTECYLHQGNFQKALITFKHFIASTKVPFIFQDDKEKWLNYVKPDLDKKDASELANLINDLTVKNRNEE